MAFGRRPPADPLDHRRPPRDELIVGCVVPAHHRNFVDVDSERMEPSGLRFPAQRLEDRAREGLLFSRICYRDRATSYLDLSVRAVSLRDDAVDEDPRISLEI